MIPPLAVAEHHQRLAKSFIERLENMTATNAVRRAHRLAFSWYMDASRCVLFLERRSEDGRAIYCGSLDATHLDFASLWMHCIEKKLNTPSSASGRCCV